MDYKAGNKHMEICKEMNVLYQKKNHDYGDSFHNGWKKYGMIMAVIRLGDKFSRLESLTINDKPAEVKEESVRDTLIDLANYAVMTIMEMDEENENYQSEL